MLTTSTLAGEPPDHRQLFWYVDESGAQQPVRTEADWQKRRATVLAAMQEVMGPLPDRSNLPPLDLKVHETFQGDTYKRHTVTFANLHGEQVTAYLYVPNDVGPGERRPGALALQPTGIEGKRRVDGQGEKDKNRGYAKELARRGFVVVAPDYPSFGEQEHYDFKSSKYASGTMKAISDNMRSIDLLQSRPDVDGNKIACIGHSLGGHNTLFTAAFDERVKVAVTSCGWTPFHHYYGGKKLVNWAQDRYMPRVRDVYGSDPDRMPFDFAEVVGAIAPRAVFTSAPVNDENFDVAGVRLATPELQKLWAFLGAPDRLAFVHPDYAHDFTEETRRQAYDFIDQQLRYEPKRKVP